MVKQYNLVSEILGILKSLRDTILEVKSVIKFNSKQEYDEGNWNVEWGIGISNFRKSMGPNFKKHKMYILRIN